MHIWDLTDKKDFYVTLAIIIDTKPLLHEPFTLDGHLYDCYSLSIDFNYWYSLHEKQKIPHYQNISKIHS
jgi:hypothetical protein